MLGADRWIPRAQSFIGIGNILHTQQRFRLPPIDQVRRPADPDVVESLAAAVDGEGSFEADVHPVDPFGEQHNIAVIGDGAAQDLDIFEVVGDGDRAAIAVIGVHGIGDVNATVQNGHAWIVTSLYIVSALKFDDRLRVNAPVADPIVAVGHADLKAYCLLLLLIVVVVVPKDHHILALILHDPRVVGDHGGIRHIFGCKNGVLGMTLDNGAGRKGTDHIF